MGCWSLCRTGSGPYLGLQEGCHAGSHLGVVLKVDAILAIGETVAGNRASGLAPTLRDHGCDEGGLEEVHLEVGVGVGLEWAPARLHVPPADAGETRLTVSNSQTSSAAAVASWVIGLQSRPVPAACPSGSLWAKPAPITTHNYPVMPPTAREWDGFPRGRCCVKQRYRKLALIGSSVLGRSYSHWPQWLSRPIQEEHCYKTAPKEAAS